MSNKLPFKIKISLATQYQLGRPYYLDMFSVNFSSKSFIDYNFSKVDLTQNKNQNEIWWVLHPDRTIKKSLPSWLMEYSKDTMFKYGAYNQLKDLWVPDMPTMIVQTYGEYKIAL